MGRVLRKLDPTTNPVTGAIVPIAPLHKWALDAGKTPEGPAPFQPQGPRGLMPDPGRYGQMTSAQRGPAPGYAPNPYQAAQPAQPPQQQMQPGGTMGGFIAQALRRGGSGNAPGGFMGGALGGGGGNAPGGFLSGFLARNPSLFGRR
jgi:hypothetical protein